jgi:histidine ammonia-lyase
LRFNESKPVYEVKIMMVIGDNPLRLDDVVRVAREHERVALSKNAAERIAGSRQWVDKLAESEEPIYGITTGFGELSKILIPPNDRKTLQRNLILSHCTGVGEYLPEDVVRAAVLLRVNSLAMGYSGIRVLTVEKLIELLNKDIYPAVPCKGSVGASGDLVPLAHMAAVLFGEGLVIKAGKAIPSGSVLKEADFEPIHLVEKEGLALINGTQIMTAVAALVCYDAVRLMKTADIASALSLEALQGTRTAFDPRVSAIRAHKGQESTARNMLALTEDSEIIRSHKDCPKVQDAYSLRCIPQVHGASKDALRQTIETVNIEMNAVTDNPIVAPDCGEIISGGNFHGQPIALVMDYLKIALAELGNISERRVNRLVDANLSGLPAFLTSYPGVNSGYMITQYTAAALVSENKTLAHPASVDSIPTSANQEDHVSMGTIGARQSREILENVRHILAIEIMTAVQGIDFLSPMRPGIGTKAAYDYLRAIVPHLDEDRVLAPDIQTVRQTIVDQTLLNTVEQAAGLLII